MKRKDDPTVKIPRATYATLKAYSKERRIPMLALVNSAVIHALRKWRKGGIL